MTSKTSLGEVPVVDASSPTGDSETASLQQSLGASETLDGSRLDAPAGNCTSTLLSSEY
ncbi:MAG: hypothetical protein JWP89_6465 [Schlesneria sp.]|nr:hypothetical protein [Schlesneria sp.]